MEKQILEITATALITIGMAIYVYVEYKKSKEAEEVVAKIINFMNNHSDN